MKLLFCKNKSQSIQIENNNGIKIFVPSVFGKLYISNEIKQFKKTLVRIYFTIMTFGKAKIFYVTSDSDTKVIHTSYVFSRCFKFPFLGKKDFIIGPCFTHPDFRGKGIYPMVLDYIVNLLGEKDTKFYMVVDSENTPSIKGIEKAGFERCGEIFKTKILKRYYIKKLTDRVMKCLIILFQL